MTLQRYNEAVWAIKLNVYCIYYYEICLQSNGIGKLYENDFNLSQNIEIIYVNYA